MRPRSMRPMGWKRRVLDEPPAPEPAAGALAQPKPEPAGKRPTRIEPGCEIEGKLTLDGPLFVEGEFRGAIECRGDVVVTETGAVQARIRGRTVVVRGAVVGDVEASRELVLAATGRLHGDVDTPSLVVERGGFFQGATRMYRPEQMARASTPAPDAATTPHAEAAKPDATPRAADASPDAPRAADPPTGRPPLAPGH